jgi:rod shape-determining protein MreD
MSKFLIYAFTIILLLSFNIAFPPILGATPNFLFLLVIFYAFRQDKSTFLWLAFFAGLILDVTSHFMFGSFTLAFLLVAFLINYSTRFFFTADVSGFFMVIVTVFSYLLLVGMLYFSYLLLVGMLYLFSSIALSLELTTKLLPTVYLHQKVWLDLVLNLIFAVPVYILTERIEKIILNIESKSVNPQ